MIFFYILIKCILCNEDKFRCTKITLRAKKFGLRSDKNVKNWALELLLHSAPLTLYKLVLACMFIVYLSVTVSFPFS